MVFFPFVKEAGNPPKGACYGVLLCDDKDNVYLPCPADIVGERKKGKNWRILKFYEGLNLNGKTFNLPLIKGTLTTFESAEGYFITAKGFEEWKKEGKISEEHIKKWNYFMEKEIKVGLQINKDTGTAEERMLYFQERIRLRSNTKNKMEFYISFIAERCISYEGFLGGERNPATVEETNNAKLPFNNVLEIKKDSYYRLYLLTHSYINELAPQKVLNLKAIYGEAEANFEVIWVYSRGSDLISGYDKPGLEMLRPGTVILLKATESASLKDIVQINNIPEAEGIPKHNFLESGWNTGILAEGGVEQ